MAGGKDGDNGECHGGGGLLADAGLLITRVALGGFLAGHGAQKLFGWFGGPGLQGTAGWLESLGLKPGSRWAPLAAASEFGGGVLTAAGLLSPLGPLTVIAPMAIATGKVHWGKPVWVTAGGAELPLTNMAAAAGLALAGPGRLSLDRAFGIRVPWPIVLLTMAGIAAGVAVALNAQPEPSETDSAESEQSTGSASAAGSEA